MKKFIAPAITSAVALLIGLVPTSAAFAMVPPEPGGPASTPPVAGQSGFTVASWGTVGFGVTAVIVGAVLALAIEWAVRRHQSASVAPA